MFKTKSFSPGDIDRGLLDAWLEDESGVHHGIMVVGYSFNNPTGQRTTSIAPGYEIKTDVSELYVTIKKWKRNSAVIVPPARSTIDEIPEEPSIEYPDDSYLSGPGAGHEQDRNVFKGVDV